MDMGQPTGTVETLAASDAARTACGFVLTSCDGWTFSVPSAHGRPSSSGRKRVVEGGRFSGPHRSVPAVAVVFDAAHGFEFGSECAALARFGQIGAGPELLAMAKVTAPAGEELLYLVEEDVGVSLEAALREGAVVPGASPRPLAPLGTAARHVQNQKIAFDVLCQMTAVHDAGLYHRDLRPANVCLRWHGERPADIRATLVDFEGATEVYAGVPRAVYRPYYELLFGAVAEPLAAVPTPLDIDMGCLALLLTELDGVDVAAGEFGRDEALAWRPAFLPPTSGAFLGVDGAGTFSPRRIQQARDVDPLARELGLRRVEDLALESAEGIRVAQRHARCGYLDAAALERVQSDPEYLLMEGAQLLARLNYRTYAQRARRRGEAVAERFEDQPAELQESGLLSARHTLATLEQLGYGLVRADRLGDRPAAEALLPREVERFAMIEHGRWVSERLAAGWQHGARKDLAQRTHPWLVPYNDLPEEEKDKNRAKARVAPAHLRQIGLALVRVTSSGAGERPLGSAEPTEGQLEAMARASFESYKAHRRRDGLPVDYERYEDQPETLRRSGIAQARGLWEKAALLGCRVVPATEADPERAVRELTPDELEFLARAEHDRWVCERRADGWVQGPERDPAAKVTPYLVAYDELSEQIKEYDRQPMRELVDRFAAAGFVLVRG